MLGIIDAELSWAVKHNFPNLACMKLSSYFKNEGSNFELIIKPTFDGLKKYNTIYVSKVFSNTIVPIWFSKKVSSITGGTGYDYAKKVKLLPDIEHSFPDYHLYDNCQDLGKNYTDYSMGFLTRGCFRKCSYCVNRNSDNVEKHSPLEEFLDHSRPKICLLDDNFLGYPEHLKMLETLQAVNKPFVFKQGLDIRLLTEKTAKMLFSSKYDGDFIFAFDNLADRPIIEEKLKLVRSLTNRNVKFYLFCGYDRQNKWDYDFWKSDIENIFRRLEILRRYQALPYLMRFDRYNESPFRGMYINLAAYCNQPWIFRKMSFREMVLARPWPSTVKYMEDYEKQNPAIKTYFDQIPSREGSL